MIIAKLVFSKTFRNCPKNIVEQIYQFLAFAMASAPQKWIGSGMLTGIVAFSATGVS